jgi:PAS domain-containing protein
MALIADDLPLGPDPPAADHPPRVGRFVAGSLLALILVGGLAATLLSVTLSERRSSLHATHSARLEALARGRAEVLATWLDGVIRLGRRLTESDLVRLFATEMALSQAGTPLARSLAEQSPYFQQLISDFARQSGLTGAALTGLDGRTLLSSPDVAPAADGPRIHILRDLARDSAPRLSPARLIPSRGAGGGTLVLDVLLPIPAAQPLVEDGAAEAAAALVMTLPIAERLTELLGAGPGQAPGDRVRLIQRGPGSRAEIVLAPQAGLAAVHPELIPDPAGTRHYGALPNGGEEAYAVGVPVPGLPWTVLAQVDADLALAPLWAFARRAGALAGLAGFTLMLAFGAFWWRRSGAHHRELATRYRGLADRHANQRRLLQSVTDGMQEMLSLKTADGRYAFVNPAFAQALGRPAESILGRSDAELLPAKAAAAMAIGDREALAGCVIAAEERAIELAISFFRPARI